MFRSRGPLLRRLGQMGYRTVALEMPVADYDAEAFAAIDAEFLAWRLRKTGLNPLSDIAELWTLWRTLRALKPDIVFSHTLKPVIYTALLAKTAGARRCVVMMPGLGYGFSPKPGIKGSLIGLIARIGCRAALGKTDLVLFQNAEDREDLMRLGVLRAEAATALVDGSGIDMSLFRATPLPPGPIRFLMLSRLLRDKGVYEFVEAARRVKRTIPDAHFVLVGSVDDNPESVPADQLEAWRNEGVVEIHGFTAAPEAAYAASHVYVLPSFHREGIPRGVIEAMACARAVITTDMPGCRDAVTAGLNGVLVPPRDANAIAAAMTDLAHDRERLRAMGEAGRRLCAERFALERVVGKTVAHIVGGSFAQRTAPQPAKEPAS